MGWAHLVMKEGIDQLLKILSRKIVSIVVLILFPNILELFDLKTALITFERTLLHGSTTFWAL